MSTFIFLYLFIGFIFYLGMASVNLDNSFYNIFTLFIVCMLFWPVVFPQVLILTWKKFNEGP